MGINCDIDKLLYHLRISMKKRYVLATFFSIEKVV